MENDVTATKYFTGIIYLNRRKVEQLLKCLVLFGFSFIMFSEWVWFC